MCSPSASRYPRAPTRPSWESCWARPSSSSLAFGMTLGALGPLGPPFPILWVVGVVNAMNFIDGVDGLASGIAAIAGTTLLLTALVKGDEASVLLAACLLGSMLGLLGARGVPTGAPPFPIARRSRSRQPIYLPDRGHLHHRLLDRGLSQRQTVLILYLVSAFFGVGALAVVGVNRPGSGIALSLMALALYIGARRMGLLDRQSPVHDPEATTGRPAAARGAAGASAGPPLWRPPGRAESRPGGGGPRPAAPTSSRSSSSRRS